MSLEQFAKHRGIEITDSIRKQIDHKVRSAAYSIIRGKGATYYGIGGALSRIVNVILYDQRSILSVCAPTAEAAGITDVTLAWPRLVGGVLETFPLQLDPMELEALRASAQVIRQALSELD